MNARRIVGTLLALGLTTLAACSFLSAPPAARFDVAAPVLYAGDTTLLDASPSVSDAALVDYRWDLGNGETASGREVTVSYALPGRYTITLTVIDAEGRSDAVSEPITVYVRSGTLIFEESFEDGESSLGRWPLDPTWANTYESRIEHIAGEPGYSLFIDSSTSNWHRRYAAISVPPLRLGQRIVFSCRAMTLQNQRSHTFLIVPMRRVVSNSTGSLPYFEFTSDGDGSYMREPTAYGPGVAHPVPFKPSVYQWHSYELDYGHDAYTLTVDGSSVTSGPVSIDLSDGGEWFILLGEESTSEASTVYYDDLQMRIVE